MASYRRAVLAMPTIEWRQQPHASPQHTRASLCRHLVRRVLSINPAVCRGPARAASMPWREPRSPVLAYDAVRCESAAPGTSTCMRLAPVNTELSPLAPATGLEAMVASASNL
eukprot:g2300.t1